MAMNFGPQDDDEIIGTINTTPLVDVMLVLLIIFLITIPVVTTSIKVDLPKETNVVRETLPENLIISVDKAGHIFLYDTPVKNGQDLFERVSALGTASRVLRDGSLSQSGGNKYRYQLVVHLQLPGHFVQI